MSVKLAIGIVSHSLAKNKFVLNYLPINDEMFVFRFLLGDNIHPISKYEISVSISSDNYPNNKHCSCTQKTKWWFKYALNKWPQSLFYAKTEDDTFIHYEKLMYDLSFINPNSDTMYGLINYVSNSTFKGTVESPRLLNELINPFPTGPLALFTKPLALTLYQDCTYPPDIPHAQFGNKCVLKNHDVTKYTCDGIIGNMIEKCVFRNITIAHMTWTKNHHNAKTGGGLGWIRPGSETVVLHYMKGIDKESWEIAKKETSGMNKTFFPPFLFMFDPSHKEFKYRFYPQNKTLWKNYIKTCKYPTGKPLMEGGNPKTWYQFGCHAIRGFNMSKLYYL